MEGKEEEGEAGEEEGRKREREKDIPAWTSLPISKATCALVLVMNPKYIQKAVRPTPQLCRHTIISFCEVMHTCMQNSKAIL